METVDYGRLRILARHLPFSGHPLQRESEPVKQGYMAVLAYVVGIDENVKENLLRLVFLQWLQNVTGIEKSLEELLARAYGLKEKDLQE